MKRLAPSLVYCQSTNSPCKQGRAGYPVRPDIRQDIGNYNFKAGYPVLSNIQPYFTEVIQPDMRQ